MCHLTLVKLLTKGLNESENSSSEEAEDGEETGEGFGDVLDYVNDSWPSSSLLGLLNLPSADPGVIDWIPRYRSSSPSSP